jgi:hypothetical protein
MPLVDGDELGPEAEANDGGANAPSRAGGGSHAGGSFLLGVLDSTCYFTGFTRGP